MNNKPKEVPMLFSTDMVKAIMAGRKTQTRRIMNPQQDLAGIHEAGIRPKCRPGDVIWGREGIYSHPAYRAKAAKAGHCGPLFGEDGQPVAFRGYVADAPDYKFFGFRGIPSIHMPKSAARLWLRVTEVRAERLHDISQADAEAEGVNAYSPFAIGAFKNLWQTLHSQPPEPGHPDARWVANPWVWVYKFEVLSTTRRPENL
jgi:hypothetical protein